MKRIDIFCISLLLMSNISCLAQVISPIPEKYLLTTKVSDTERTTIISKYSPVDLTRYLPRNYSTTGRIDYTEYLQRGIDENKYVLLPNMPILINDNGLQLRSNSVIIFNTNSKLILKGSNKANYNIINLNKVTSVKVYFANLSGDRANHLGNTGEWGMGLGIWNSSSITIYKPAIVNCWGDGIYINNSADININGAFLNNNRRNGISVISGANIYIENMVAANTNGTLPKAGIDIEPNSNNETIKNIVIKNPITYNNYRGILISLYNFSGTDSKNVDISVDNPLDDGSNRAIDLYVNKKKLAHKSMTGTIAINNPQWINQKETIIFYNRYGFKNGVNINLNYSSNKLNIDSQRRLKIIKEAAATNEIKVSSN